MLLVGCGEAAPTPEAGPPWDEPVDGAAAVTEWEDHGQPTTPFGPGGYPWGSPEELVTAMAQALAASDGVRTNARVVERRQSGTVIGWVRLDLDEVIARDGLDDGALAADMRVEMRNDGGNGWFVVRTESRQHCSRKLVDGECR